MRNKELLKVIKQIFMTSQQETDNDEWTRNYLYGYIDALIERPRLGEALREVVDGMWGDE